MSNQTDIASAALTRTALLVKEAVFPELAEREIVRALTRTRVRLSADEETLASQAGQTALVSAFVSVAQLGAHIFVNIPETGLIHPQPPIVGEELLSGLLEHSQDLIAPAASDHVTPVDLEIVFGAATPQLDVSKHPVLLSCGDDWSTSLTPLADSKPHPWAGRYPIGAMFAGVAIGAEVFRVVLTALAEENGLASAGGLYLGGAKPLRVGLPPLQLPSVINLGAIDFVSAGAITNAALFTLLRVPGLRARIRVIDDDILRLENLNRYLLALRSQVGQIKVRQLASFSTPEIGITPVAKRFDENSRLQILPLAPRVLVGVDDIPSRWLVQKQDPNWLCVGATANLQVQVTTHRPGNPCTGCVHPEPDPDPDRELPTVSFVSAAAGAIQVYCALAHVTSGASWRGLTAFPSNLAGEYGLLHRQPGAVADCPVRCQASRALRQAA